MVPQQSAKFPRKRSRFEPQWDIFPRIYNCIFVYLLMEECISNLVYWYGVQGLGQEKEGITV